MLVLDLVGDQIVHFEWRTCDISKQKFCIHFYAHVLAQAEEQLT